MKRVMMLLMAGAVMSGVAAYMAAARTLPGTGRVAPAETSPR
jgi:hypothetical protein